MYLVGGINSKQIGIDSDVISHRFTHTIFAKRFTPVNQNNSVFCK